MSRKHTFCSSVISIQITSLCMLPSYRKFLMLLKKRWHFIDVKQFIYLKAKLQLTDTLKKVIPSFKQEDFLVASIFESFKNLLQCLYFEGIPFFNHCPGDKIPMD